MTEANLDIVREKLCCEAVHRYLFENVYNEPVSEYRINIRPKLVKTTSAVGSLSLVGRNLLLPTTDEPFYVWVMAAQDFSVGLTLPSEEWVDTATICNTYKTLVHMYGVNGYMFQKANVYLRYNRSRSLIYVAAKKPMVKKCIPVQQLNECYLTIYYDSDVPNDVTVTSIYVETSRKLTEYQRQIDNAWATIKDACQLTVFKNGMEVTDINNTPTLKIGDYIDIIVDKNIQFSFEIDLTTTNENPVFYSEEDKAYKQLLHIPRALNPDNKVITHNTCDFYVRKALSNTTQGLYLHRAAKDRSVTQVTHNDMAVQLFVLDAYRDYLKTQEIKLYCVVRIHEKDNHLVRDANFIDLLYNDIHDDEDIINILVGKGPKQIPWWKAEVTEKSNYVKYMFDTPDFADPSEIDGYVKALGYYQVVNLLCHRINEITITDAYTGTLTYHLPVIYHGLEVVPVVYLNGKVLRREYVSYVNHGNDLISITVDNKIVTKPGDKLTTVLYVTGDNSIYHFSPEIATLSITVPYSSPSVYMKSALTARDALPGVGADYREVWIKLNVGTNKYVAETNEDDSTTITFNFELVGSEFMICNDYCSYVQTINLADYTTDGKTIAIPARSTFKGSIDPCPILNFSNLSLYLNGSYLVKGIDYYVNDVTDEQGNLAMREVVIQTMDHFNEEGDDNLDIIYNVAEVEDNSNGFVIDGELRDNTPVNLYFENISLVHVDGKLVRDLDYKGVYIELPEDPNRPQGQIFEIQTALPELVRNYLNKYTVNEDYDRIKIMNEYFYELIHKHKDFLVLEGKHRIYSTFINNLLYDIVHGSLTLVDDPDISRFQTQIEEYLYLKDKDITFAGLDQRFMDFYPQYVNYEVDPTTKALLDRIIALYMPKNEDPTLEVVYE